MRAFFITRLSALRLQELPNTLKENNLIGRASAAMPAATHVSTVMASLQTHTNNFGGHSMQQARSDVGISAGTTLDYG